MIFRKRKYPLLFVVEDNTAFSKIVEHHLKANGYSNVMLFSSGEDCLKNIFLRPDIVIQDYKLQGISGINVLQRYKKVLPSCEFIFLSGQEDIETAINTVKQGAFDYIIKNEVALQRLIQKLESIIKLQKLKKRNRKYRVAFYIAFFLFLIVCMIIFFSSDIYIF